MGSELHVDLYQNSQATARIMSTGRAPALRQVKRAHGASIAWVIERIVLDDVVLHDCMSSVMAADIFTERFVSMGQVDFGV